jgi:hypothetical protein
MKFVIYFALLFGLMVQNLSAANNPSQLKRYRFAPEPIDVVIPTVEKDLETLNLCIAGIRANCSEVRRIIVVSSRPLTDEAEWFDETLFPFSKRDVAFYLANQNEAEALAALSGSNRIGWYFQQLLKLYAPFVIPDISGNVLVLDSDTIFLNPVKFLNDDFAGNYNPGFSYHKPYLKHAGCLIPGFAKIFSKFSGISHHMLFQYPVLQDLFSAVESFHRMPFWEAFCRCVRSYEFSGASEYEIYFNFAFSRTDQVKIRPLQWTDVHSLDNLDEYKALGFHYVSCHSYLR